MFNPSQSSKSMIEKTMQSGNLTVKGAETTGVPTYELPGSDQKSDCAGPVTALDSLSDRICSDGLQSCFCRSLINSRS